MLDPATIRGGQRRELPSCLGTYRKASAAWSPTGFDQLFDGQSDPFSVEGSREQEKEAGGAALGGPGAKSAAQAQLRPTPCGKQLRKESQKDRKNPLPPSVGVVDKKEETQPPVAPRRRNRDVLEEKT